MKITVASLFVLWASGCSCAPYCATSSVGWTPSCRPCPPGMILQERVVPYTVTRSDGRYLTSKKIVVECVHTQTALSQRLNHIAENEITKYNANLSAEARKVLDELILNGSLVLEYTRQTTPQGISRADESVRLLTRKIIQIDKRSEKGPGYAEFLKFSLCPIWPFC